MKWANDKRKKSIESVEYKNSLSGQSEGAGENERTHDNGFHRAWQRKISAIDDKSQSWTKPGKCTSDVSSSVLSLDENVACDFLTNHQA